MVLMILWSDFEPRCHNENSKLFSARKKSRTFLTKPWLKFKWNVYLSWIRLFAILEIWHLRSAHCFELRAWAAHPPGLCLRMVAETAAADGCIALRRVVGMTTRISTRGWRNVSRATLSVDWDPSRAKGGLGSLDGFYRRYFLWFESLITVELYWRFVLYEACKLYLRQICRLKRSARWRFRIMRVKFLFEFTSEKQSFAAHFSPRKT